MVWKIFKKNNRRGNEFVEPDEIFLDSKNLANFDRQQFEGRIEKTIPKRTIVAVGIFFAIFAGIFGGRLTYLQIGKGEASLPTRAYLTPGFSHILGYVSYPTQDKAGNYWQGEFEGLDGLEKQYNGLLTGENGAKIIETDARGKTYSENIVNAPKQGTDLVTSIDARVQKELFT